MSARSIAPRSRAKRAVFAHFVLVVCAVMPAIGAFAQAGVRPTIEPGTGGAEMALRGVGVDENYESAIPDDVLVRDHEGREVTFGQLWRGDRPAVLQFVYHSCATACDGAMRALTSVLSTQPRTVGIDLDVFVVSMDPRDTPEDAADARRRMLGRYGRAEAEQGWHVLVGEESQVRRIADAVGYRYRWDEASRQFAHPAVLIVLRAGDRARVGRYLYGIEPSPNDLRLSLAEAADGRTLDAVEAALLYCFVYDAAQNRYVLMAWRIMRVGAGITALVLAGVLAWLWRREIRARRTAVAEASPSPAPATRGSTAASS